MINTLLGLKLDMSQTFDRLGQRVPVTNVLAGPNVVLAVTKDKVQLGLGKKKKLKKPQRAYIDASGFAPRFIKEVSSKVDSSSETGGSPTSKDYLPGETFTVSIFKPGDLVKVTGITKGKGFAGVVKRWGFAGGPKTHGQSDRHRAPGSIGQTTTPGRVFKGKKMAGHMGVSKLTIRGLEVIEVDESRNLLKIKGPLPGAKNSLLIVEKVGRAKNYTFPHETEEGAKEKKVDESLKVQESQKVEQKEAINDDKN